MLIQTLEEIIQTIEGSKRTLYILCGLPYSGKTYFAGTIVKETGCAFVSIDQIFKGLQYDWDTNKLPDEKGWKEIFDTSYLKSQEVLKNDSNVLYDSTNHTKISRDALRKIAGGVGAQTRVIYISISNETLWKRWEENLVKKERSIVDKKLVQMTIDSFEVPTEDEGVLTVQNG
jgi:predicted kinase